MMKHIGRLALVGILGVSAFIIADMIIPAFDEPALGSGSKPENDNQEVIDVTPEN